MDESLGNPASSDKEGVVALPLRSPMVIEVVAAVAVLVVVAVAEDRMRFEIMRSSWSSSSPSVGFGDVPGGANKDCNAFAAGPLVGDKLPEGGSGVLVFGVEASDGSSACTTGLGVTVPLRLVDGTGRLLLLAAGGGGGGRHNDDSDGRCMVVLSAKSG